MNSFTVTCLVISLLVICATCNEQACDSGETKKIDCNNCRCVGGVWACTRKACVEKRERRETSCTPGTTFKLDCNTCICSQDGKNAACTLKGCVKYSDILKTKVN